MTWNWQLPDWPNFTWDRDPLHPLEEAFLFRAGELAGTVKHLCTDDQQELSIERLSEEAVTSSEIEGEILDRASVQSSIRRQLGVASIPKRSTPAEQGMAEMMVDLHRSFRTPLTHQALFAWHRMVMAGRHDLTEIGCYRTEDAPMQIVSEGRFSDAPNVHFEAPPSARVGSDMEAYVTWFNASHVTLPALTRAGMVHLYFESIHPFEDGNGRLGRAISEKSLSQSLGTYSYLPLTSVILGRRKAYYHELERASQTLDLTEWLRWFAETATEAQDRAIKVVDFVLAKANLFDRLKGQLNPRQEKVLLRLFKEGPDGFRGGLSADNYMKIAGTTSATTTRDLADLVEKGALVRTGEKRYARYWLPTQQTD